MKHWETIKSVFWAMVTGVFILGIVFCVVWVVYNSIHNHKSNKFWYSERIIEGCEYLTYPVDYGWMAMTHKGNCTNAIHRLTIQKGLIE